MNIIRYALISIAALICFSCSSGDDSKDTGTTMTYPTKTELEATTSFSYKSSSSSLYLKFRGGKMYTYQVMSSSGQAINKDTLDYSIEGQTFKCTFYNSTLKITKEYVGVLYIKAEGTNKDMILKLSGDDNIPVWLSNTYKFSSYNF